MPSFQIKALQDKETITVYQAFDENISQSAVKHQTFVSPPFRMERMTWIKPSFLWMMYRSGWATKPKQEHILSIRILKSGFDWALQNACLSNFNEAIHSSYDVWKDKLHSSPVRVQWDPERDIYFNPLDFRTIQVGLSHDAVVRYLNNWIVSITDITQTCKAVENYILEGESSKALQLLPVEIEYLPNINAVHKINLNLV